MTISNAWGAVMQAEDQGAAATTAATARLSTDLTKAQLAEALDCSTRFIEYREKEGMPSGLRGRKRYYRLEEVVPWLTEREARLKAAQTARTNLRDLRPQVRIIRVQIGRVERRSFNAGCPR